MSHNIAKTWAAGQLGIIYSGKSGRETRKTPLVASWEDQTNCCYAAACEQKISCEKNRPSKGVIGNRSGVGKVRMGKIENEPGKKKQ